MNEPYRLRHANQIVGAFLLVFLILIVVISFVLLRTGDYIVAKHQYWIEVEQDEVSDLPRGAAVMILGRYAGQVKSIDYVENSTLVHVDIQVDADIGDEIRTDSIVSIARKFGVGAPILSIRRNPQFDGPRTPLPPGSEIKGFIGSPDRLEQMAEKVADISGSIVDIRTSLVPTLASIEATSKNLEKSLDENANPAFNRAETAFESMNQTSETLRPEAKLTMASLRESVTRLEVNIRDLTGKIATLVDTDIAETLDAIRETSNETKRAAEAVKGTAKDTNENLAETLTTIKSAAEQMEILARESQQIARILRSEAQELPGTTERANDTLSEAQDLVGEVRSHWLLRRYNNSNQPTGQVSPSRVRGDAL